MEENHDLGCGLRKEFWNRGIVTEAGKAVIKRVKDDGKQDRVYKKYCDTYAVYFVETEDVLPH